jgi:hypothetical protein
VPPTDLAGHLAGGDVESGEQRGGATGPVPWAASAGCG